MGQSTAPLEGWRLEAGGGTGGSKGLAGCTGLRWAGLEVAVVWRGVGRGIACLEKPAPWHGHVVMSATT